MYSSYTSSYGYSKLLTQALDGPCFNELLLSWALQLYMCVIVPLFYLEKVNLDDIKDENERRRIECMINNFGQTPTKLFTVRVFAQSCDCHVIVT